jgi:hypothetical protein
MSVGERGPSRTNTKSMAPAGGAVAGVRRVWRSTGGLVGGMCVKYGGVCASTQAGGKEGIWCLHRGTWAQRRRGAEMSGYMKKEG